MMGALIVEIQLMRCMTCSRTRFHRRPSLTDCARSPSSGITSKRKFIGYAVCWICSGICYVLHRIGVNCDFAVHRWQGIPQYLSAEKFGMANGAENAVARTHKVTQQSSETVSLFRPPPQLLENRLTHKNRWEKRAFFATVIFL